MRLIFKPKNYKNNNSFNRRHSVPNRCSERTTATTTSASTLTPVNILYLKSLGYNVGRTTIISRPKLR